MKRSVSLSQAQQEYISELNEILQGQSIQGSISHTSSLEKTIYAQQKKRVLRNDEKKLEKNKNQPSVQGQLSIMSKIQNWWITIKRA